MQSSQRPANFPIPFAANADTGFIRSIPTASQIGIVDGAASLNDGFPPKNFDEEVAGGVPPNGADFNGILKWSTEAIRYLQAGGEPAYDPTFATAIGGYPLGAVLIASSRLFYWVSTVENNTTNPDAGGAGWRKFPSGQYWGSEVGSGNIYTINLSVDSIIDGDEVAFLATHACTGASTINIGSGNVPLRNNLGGALLSGDIVSGQMVVARYYASAQMFLMVSASKPVTVPVGSIIPFIGGYFTGNNNTGFTNVLGNDVASINTRFNPSGFWVSNGAQVNDSRSLIYNGPGRYLPNITDDRFLMGSTVSGTIGGSNTDTHTHAMPHTHYTAGHTLTSAEIPPHAHPLLMYQASGASGGYYGGPASSASPQVGWINGFIGSTGGGAAHDHGATGQPTIANTGVTSVSDKRPNFIRCFMLTKVF